jgi:cyclic beta-1,2-glucan synthetase
VEPYVLAADVYASPTHVRRGGWTWYTGSAGWMQRAGIESILGLRVEKALLYLDPCIPKAWPGFEVTLRHASARYEILLENPDGVGRGIASAQLDEQEILAQPLRLPLADDGLSHRLRVRLGQSVPGVSSVQDSRGRS